MSKIYDKYLELKEQDQEKIYLFRCGNFYIFLAEDAEFINQYVVLKKTQFTKDVMKCGFPIKSKDDYLKVFQNHGLNIKIIEDVVSSNLLEKEKKVVAELKKLDINHLTPMQAMEKLLKLQEMCNEN